MRALLLIGHGSKAELANEQLTQLAALYPLSEQIQFVEVCYLEIAFPDIPGGIDLCVQRGAKEIVVMPYFLFDGMHVAKDIPAQIDEAVLRHPNVHIVLTPPIGVDPMMVELIMQRVKSAFK